MGFSFRRSVLVACAMAAVLPLGHAGAQDAEGPEAQEKTAPGAAAQPAPRRAPRATDVQKVFVIRHIYAHHLATLLRVFPASIEQTGLDRQTTALAVSASPAVLAAIEETIKRLDVPEPAGRSVELTGYILEASGSTGDAGTIPNDLADVVAQLKRVLDYPTYRMIDTLVTRARDGSSVNIDSVASKVTTAQRAATFYSLRAVRTTVSSVDGAPSIRLDGLRFGAEIPVPVRLDFAGSPASLQYKHVGFDGDVEIRDGRRVVVGKSGLGDGSSAIILVVSAKVVD